MVIMDQTAHYVCLAFTIQTLTLKTALYVMKELTHKIMDLAFILNAFPVNMELILQVKEALCA